MTASEAAVARLVDRLADRRAAVRVLAGGLALGAMTCALLAVVLHYWAGQRGYRVWVLYPADVLLGLALPPVGALLVRRRPGNAAGWVLLLSGTLLGVQALTKQWAFHGGVAEPGSLPLTGVATFFAAWTFAGYWPLITLLPLLFPDGRAPSPRWRRFALVVAAAQASAALAAAFRPGDLDGIEELTNPLAVHAVPIEVLQVMQIGGSWLGFLGAAPACLVALTLRQRGAEGRERAQLQWLLLGFVIALVGVFASIPVQQLVGRTVGDLTMAAGLLAIPAAILVAVLRAGLFDVQLVVNRAVVYAGLSLLGAGVWAVVVVVAGTSAGPLVAAAVAVAATLARGRVQVAVDRWLFGARRDPYRVVSSVGAALDAALDVAGAVQTLLGTVRTELRLPALRVVGDDGTVLAASGEPVAEVEVLPLVDAGRSFGVLEVGHRFRGEQWRAEETSVLQEVVRRLAGVLHAASLTEDVQRSRERIVTAREEERRRLRRDLHDGLGPMLAGMALQVDSLGRVLPDAERTRAERLRHRMQEAVVEVRRIVDDLRPASLDELGLAGALEQLLTDERVALDLDPDALVGLPAAAEVAAYRVVAEAATNALRHSGAQHVRVGVHREEGELRVVVEDDGSGFTEGAARGVGLRSMAERAEELGGRCAVSTSPDGTRVEACLPLVVR